MEYVSGITLAGLLRRNKRFAAARVARLVGQVCEVLQEAHDRNVIHQDLKPSNLMVVDADSPEEQVRVMDFGMARIRSSPGSAAAISRHGSEFAAGTPGYISPEQVWGTAADHRSDLYSVGVIAFELLSGRLPFQRETSMDAILAHATEPPPRFAEIGSGDWVPRPVEEVVLACLEKDPQRRPQSARELAERFNAALDPSLEPRPPSIDDLREVLPAFDPDALVYHFDAWMPRRIAMMKIRGFVHDFAGEVVASWPGRVRIQTQINHAATQGVGPRRRQPLGPSSRLQPLTLELLLSQIDPKRENRLRVTVIFYPPGGEASPDLHWQQSCVRTFCDLRGYLMGQT
jgi:serine/threonine-protein kinase